MGPYNPGPMSVQLRHFVSNCRNVSMIDLDVTKKKSVFFSKKNVIMIQYVTLCFPCLYSDKTCNKNTQFVPVSSMLI